MHPSQPQDMKPPPGTLVGPGSPRARSENTLQSASTFDTGLSAAGTTLQLVRDAGEVASQVPYVKAVAGVLSQIIKIRDEIQANNERCGEIIDLVQLKSTTILQSLDSVYFANGVRGFEDLRSELEAYADFLRTVLRDELEPYKNQSRWRSYINRGKNASDLQKLQRQLDEFKNRFSVKRLVAISVDARNTLNLLSKPASRAKAIPQALPPAPKLVVGREPVVESVVENILSSSEPRIAVLGLGGMGKTTIGTTVLHDPRITSAYPTKYFISSELAPTIELLETRIADALSIHQSEQGTDLVSRIVDCIRNAANPVLIYIDNLETVWEIESEQPKVDRFLEVLSGANSKLAILITMRGTQAPKTSFPWDPTILDGLDSSNSISMYEKLSRQPADVPARELLLMLGGSPLAIQLFAMMAVEGDSPSELLTSWNEHGAKTLEIGGKHRLSSLEQSIRLSVFSPRVDDAARLVLGLIALMPDSLPTSQPWFGGFQSVLPDGALLQPTLRTLRRVALLDKKGEPSRWHMLPPIRQFCLQLIEPPSHIVAFLAESYFQRVIRHRNVACPESQAIILPEMANIRGLLLRGSQLQPPSSLIGQASVEYVNWAHWQHMDESNIVPSILRLPILTSQKASLYRTLGLVHHRWYRLDAAEEAFTCALALYTETKDPRGEADIHVSIGRVNVCRDQLDAAEASFSRALNLYISGQHRTGEAHTLRSIGQLHMRQDNLDEAEASMNRSLDIYVNAQHRRGEANVRRPIGELNLRRGRLDAAKMAFTSALKLYVEIHNKRGIATCTLLLGKVCLREQLLEAADEKLSLALAYWKEIDNIQGIAEAHLAIGELQLKRMRLDDAETSLTLALSIFNGGIESRINEALTNRSFGELHLLRGQFEDSEIAFRRALELDIATRSRAGQGQSHRGLGRMFMEKGDHAAAELSYSGALRLFLEIDDYQVDSCLIDLGRVWVLQGKIEKCEASDVEILKARWNAKEKPLLSESEDETRVSI